MLICGELPGAEGVKKWRPRARSVFSYHRRAMSARSGGVWRWCAAVQIAVHTPDEVDWANLPADNLVLQLHWPPTTDFLRCLQDNEFGVVALVRHPLDVLLSILQFSPSEPLTARWLDGAGGSEAAIYGQSPNSLAFQENMLQVRGRRRYFLSHANGRKGAKSWSYDMRIWLAILWQPF